jgi:hypothetical protein
MDALRRLDDFQRQIQSHPDEVQLELVLLFFAKEAAALDSLTLELLQRYFEARSDHVDSQLAQVIEGHLALRKLGGL